MTKRFLSLCVVVLSILVLVPLASAQGRGKSKDKGKKSKEASFQEAGIRVELAFSLEEKNIIVDWFSDEANTKGLPPGLAKRDELPPGLQKHLVKNGTLPPGLEKRLAPLPSDLSRRLPPLPDGVRRVILAGSVILLDEKSSKILDLVEDVVDLTD